MSPKELINHACIAQKRAKAPYSNYKVGAALWIKNDIIVLGCNIESKAYPTTLCAERVAIFSALDNLVKGASGQAIQNMNLMFNISNKFIF